MKLSDISPLSGIAASEDVLGKLASAGGLGLLPAVMSRDEQSDEEKRKRQMGAPMKKGGKVSSASKRADGIAVKGKTRGTMITMKNGGKC
jgi:hypothetical protein